MSFLNTRYLRLPLWAWILILGVSFGVVMRVRSARNAAATPDATGDPNAVVDTTGAGDGYISSGTAGGYDASGLSGFPGYNTQGVDSGGGIASGGTADNTNPALIDAIVAQNDTLANLFGTLTAAHPEENCGPGTHWDPVSARCVPTATNPVTTTPGGGTGTTGGSGQTTTTTGGTQKKAVPKCGGGKRYDFLRGTCTSCGAGQTYDAGTKHCRPMTHAEAVHALSIQKQYA